MHGKLIIATVASYNLIANTHNTGLEKNLLYI